MGHHLVGIFTERDYLHRVFLQNKSSKNTKVGEVMTKNVITVPPNATLYHTLQTMVHNKFRTLPIVSLVGSEIDDTEKSSLIGMITSMDIIKFIIQNWKC